jgi:integrase
MARVNPRNIPSDAEIQAAAKLIPNSSWFWAYGMMATFGLRNHELFFINHELLISDGICEVTEGKTTGGKVWPLYPEWLDYFDLRSIRVPAITSPNHKGYGHAVGKAFRRYGVPFSPYCLRHAWARRAIEMGLDSRLASKQMRHSHSVHVKIYNAWLDDSIHQRAFERILDDKNRPKPPIG